MSSIEFPHEVAKRLGLEMALLEGDGDQSHPYLMTGIPGRHQGLKKAFAVAQDYGISILSVAGSGRYYHLREDGWYECASTYSCCEFHGIPETGRKVSG